MTEKFQYYRGYKFTLDEKTGYYLNSTLHIRMHRFVWVCEKGEIPKGYHIHHKDGDKSNNSIDNLELIDAKMHSKLHADQLTDEQREWRRNNLNTNARPKAVEWHKSEEAKQWHSEHAKEMIEKGIWNAKQEYVCEQCGKIFEQRKVKGHKFCSGACQQKWLRKNEPTGTRICVVCGNNYTCKVSSNSRTCSKHCSNILWHNPEMY